MNEFNKQQSAKILAVYGVPTEDISKGKGFEIGQIDKAGLHVKTAEGWKSIKTHGHLVRHPHPEAGKKIPVEKIISPIVTETPVEEVIAPVISPTKSLVEIRNDKNRKLSHVEEKLDEHYRGINILEDDELIFLREQRKLLQASIESLDKKIKTQKDDEIAEKPVEQEVTEDVDAEPTIAA